MATELCPDYLGPCQAQQGLGTLGLTHAHVRRAASGGSCRELRSCTWSPTLQSSTCGTTSSTHTSRMKASGTLPWYAQDRHCALHVLDAMHEEFLLSSIILDEGSMHLCSGYPRSQSRVKHSIHRAQQTASASGTCTT